MKSFAAQNAFNTGASVRANNGTLKNPFSRAAEPDLHHAWTEGWKAEEAAIAQARKP